VKAPRCRLCQKEHWGKCPDFAAPVTEQVDVADLKSVAKARAGSTPAGGTKSKTTSVKPRVKRAHISAAEVPPFKREVAGSSPAAPTKSRPRSQVAKAPDFDSGIARSNRAGAAKGVGPDGEAGDCKSSEVGSIPTTPSKLTGYQRLKAWREKNPDKAKAINRESQRKYRKRQKGETE
jgi:hypothetical protein